MFKPLELKAAMVRAGITQKALAARIGISEQTLIRKMRTGKFTIQEVSDITKVLKLDNIQDIFFAD